MRESGSAEDEDLITQVREGHVHAYEGLVERHQTIAFRVAWLITRSTPDAEEAAQDGFVKAYRNLDRFQSGKPFRPWLLQIVANEARNRRASEQRRERLALRAGREPALRSGPGADVAAVASEERRALLAAIGRLDERDQSIIAARFFLELSEAEAAMALGIRRGTVKSRLNRALGRLRKELERDA
ncbi:MAG: sigma-70 family RNA polymerase sigma factor [Actinobacteria bacterium]|nr:sigma-70 family RNA polymerase sigma factor [Actinomycetota bacterium]